MPFPALRAKINWKAGVERQSRNRAREAVFIVVIFLEFGGASLPKILSAADKLAKSTNQTFMSISPLVPLMLGQPA
ncbi:hypothetical protein [Pseudomonas gelidaquae]|uniref:hypothetical protein n=1 Tax=Pseudomonas sp. IB20 TaxID=1702250 RepID=UPI0012D2D1A2|nr:hypothetical protein [Pseudomonas sp. IB20]